MAHSSPDFIGGEQPTAAQWNGFFAAKQNYSVALDTLIAAMGDTDQLIVLKQSLALDAVDNTADFDKPISLAVAQALAGKASVTSVAGKLDAISFAPPLTLDNWEWGATPAYYTRLARLTPTANPTNRPTIGDYFALTGSTGYGYVDYQVAHAAWFTMGPNGANLYAENPGAEFSAGAQASGVIIEGNINNRAGDAGDSLAVAGWSPYTSTPWRIGFQVVGGGQYLNNFGIGVGVPPGYGPQFGRGFCTYGASIKYAGVQLSDTTAIWGVRVDGNQTYGLDTSGATGMTDAVVASYGQAVSFLRSDGIKAAALNLTSDHQLQIGYSTSQITAGANIIPAAPNYATLGNAANPFEALYVHTSPVVTSDERAKSNIEDLDGDMSERFIMALRPRSFQMNIGSADTTVVESDGLVQATTPVTRPVAEMVEVDGRWEQHWRYDTVDEPVWEEVPVYVPGTNIQATELPTDSKTGLAIPDASPRLLTRRVPRMIAGKVTTVMPVSRSGVRPHTGLIAQEVRAVLDTLGVDLALHKGKGDDPQGLVMEEFIAPLLLTVQRLTARVAALEAKGS